MEIRQLQHFVAAAEEGHFTRAARRMNIVQSALSTSIRSLEEEIGARLFQRSTRQVRLTAVGEAFLEKARTVLDAVRDARDTVAALQGLHRGTLSIGTVQALPAFFDLPSLLARFHAQHPGIEVRLCQGSSMPLLEKIRTGRLDLAFLPIYEAPADIATNLIACEALVVACAPGHPLAGGDELSLAALKDVPFVDFEQGWGTRKIIDRSFAEAGVDRHTAFEVSDLDTLLDLVARDLGIALVPEAIVEARQPALGLGRLAEPEICWELVVAYAPGGRAGSTPGNPAACVFLDLLSDARRAAGLAWR